MLNQRMTIAINLPLSSDMLNLRQLLLLCCISLYLASSAPTVAPPTDPPSGLSAEWEEARQIWNGVRSVKKLLAVREQFRARDRRSDVTPTPPVTQDHHGLDNVSVPAYVKELYWNISLQDSEDIDATTIRSLPAMHSGEKDGKYHREAPFSSLGAYYTAPAH